MAGRSVCGCRTRAGRGSRGSGGSRKGNRGVGERERVTIVPTSVSNVGRQMDVRDGAISCLHARPRPNCRYADSIVSSCGSSWVRENYETDRESEGERRDEGATAERGSSRHFFTR